MATSKSQTISIVERLSDGSYVVSINGAEYRSFNSEKMKQLEADKAELTILRIEKSQLESKITLTEQQRDDLKNSLQDAKVLIAQQRQMLDQEVAFRKESVQMVPHGNVSGFGGTLLKALDSPYFQFAIKVAVPIATTYGTYTRSSRCTP